MSLIVQNLRAIGPGVAPQSLLPGQLAFNLSDRILFVGDGSSLKTSFDGSQVAGVPGEGWFSLPLSFSGFADYYLVDPQFYNDTPTNGQFLTWDSTLGRSVWVDSPTGNNPVAYLTSNAAVASAPGADTSSKISNALNVTPKEGDSVIITGDPGDQFAGFYQFLSGSWVFAASREFPTAEQVPLLPIPGLIASNVQDGLASTFALAQTANSTANSGLAIATTASVNASQALLDAATAQTTADSALTEANSAQADATAAQNTANIALQNSIDAVDASNQAVSTANEAYAFASGALLRSGGTMTGNINFVNNQPVDAGTF